MRPGCSGTWQTRVMETRRLHEGGEVKPRCQPGAPLFVSLFFSSAVLAPVGWRILPASSRRCACEVEETSPERSSLVNVSLGVVVLCPWVRTRACTVARWYVANPCASWTGRAHYHNGQTVVIPSPSICPVQVSAITPSPADGRGRSRMVLHLLQHRKQPCLLILLDGDQLHRQRQARVSLDEDQDLPSICGLFLGRRFFLPCDGDAAGVLHLAAPFITLWRGPCPAIQIRHMRKPCRAGSCTLGVKRCSMATSVHVVGQAPGAAHPRVWSAPLFALVRMEADEPHQLQRAKEHAWRLMHGWTATASVSLPADASAHAPASCPKNASSTPASLRSYISSRSSPASYPCVPCVSSLYASFQLSRSCTMPVSSDCSLPSLLLSMLASFPTTPSIKMSVHCKATLLILSRRAILLLHDLIPETKRGPR